MVFTHFDQHGLSEYWKTLNHILTVCCVYILYLDIHEATRKYILLKQSSVFYKDICIFVLYNFSRSIF